MESSLPTLNDAGAPLIVAHGVRKHYGNIHAVDGVDLDIRSGELFGLIGHNGAGKSTLFKMMLGLIPPTAGDIRIGGALVTGRDFRAVRRTVGYLPENVVLYDNLTGLETLWLFAKLKGAPPAEAAPTLERVGLAHAAKRRILFLDEPTTGLDPEAIRSFYATLRQLRSEGVTTVITSHILAEIQERVDRIAIMTAGKVQARGTVQDLREQVDLPLWFSVRVAKEDFEVVREALSHLQVDAIEAHDDHVKVRCRREAKMAVIEALARLDGRVHDLTVREPSLEDVFFGFSD